MVNLSTRPRVAQTFVEMLGLGLALGLALVLALVMVLMLVLALVMVLMLVLRRHSTALNLRQALPAALVTTPYHVATVCMPIQQPRCVGTLTQRQQQLTCHSNSTESCLRVLRLTIPLHRQQCQPTNRHLHPLWYLDGKTRRLPRR